MVQPRQEFLGPITVLDADGSGTVDATGAELVNLTVVLNSLASQPTTGAGTGAFWVEDGAPTIPRFTASDGTTVTLGSTGTDTNAIHDNTSGEIVLIPEKLSPADDDVLIIEDSADRYSKRRLAIGSLPGGTDTNAIHDNVSGEIVLITEKFTPDNSDFLVIEDSTDGYSKRRLAIGSLPGGGGGGETLEQTLALGNTTGSNWILVDDTYGIDSSAAGGSLRILAGGGTTGMMLISCGSNPAGSGGAMILESGGSSSGDSGGAINILAGSSTDIGLGGSGGQIFMSAGNGDLTGGGINIGAGQGGTNGGNLSIISGEGMTGNGGALSITAGNGYLVGADLTISAGDSATGGGGVATLQSGNGYTGGGHAFVYAGDTEYNNGGMLQIRSGSSTYNGGGAINVTAGPGETGGGTVYVTAGNCNTGNSGSLYLSAGGSTTIPYANNGGNIYLTAGPGAVGGFVSISGGFDHDGYYGDVLVRGDNVNIEMGSNGLFLRAGLYRTLSFFEHTNLDGFFLQPSQAGEMAMFRVSNALAFWDDTNNFYTEITDRLIPTI